MATSLNSAVLDINRIQILKDKESFQVWKFEITVSFKANELYDIVSGAIKNEDVIGIEQATWTRKDSMAQKLIITSIDKKLLMHIINCKSSKEMYDKLCSIYGKETSQEKCSLLQEFFNYKYEKGTDISMHISKLENLAYRLKTVNQEIDNEMLMSKILATLPEKFKYFTTAWESTVGTDRNLTNLTSRLLSEEERNKSKESESTVAFRSNEKLCFRCKTAGHISRFCPKNKMVNDNERKCFTCGSSNHLARNCDKKSNKTECKICKKNNHVEKDCFFRKKEDTKTRSSNLAFLTETESKIKNIESFIVDSACTAHMSNNKNIFSKIESVKAEVQTAKKSNTIKVEGKGSIEAYECDLNEVLYVPDLSKNLLSVNAITENNGEVHFSKNKVIVTKNRKTVLEGTKEENGLYVINLTEEQKNATCLLTQNKKKAIEWHKKLGHLSKENMKKLIEISSGMNINRKDCDQLNEICEVCMKSKQTRLPFSSERHRAKRPLEILHTDICGPIDPATWDKKKYMLTILDDYTHYCVVYLLEDKNEAEEYLKEFVEEAEAFHNKRVSKIRCDNGGEFVNHRIKKWSKAKGIFMDYTIPYSPQLNGKAERLNRTLVEKARALIFDSKITKEFWGEAVRVAAYLLNRSPTEAVDVTPIEKWTRRRPDLSRIQVFGNKAYAKVLGHIKKLDSRSEEYTFVGYAQNGYRLWDKKKRNIVIYRDVVFTEHSKNRERNQDEEEIEENLNETLLEINVENKIKNQESKNKNQEGINAEQEIENEEQESEIENQEENENQEQNEEDDYSLGEGRPTRKVKLPGRYEDYAMLTYEEAVNGTEKQNWKKAIEDEKQSLEKNEVWDCVKLSEVNGKKVLTSKWVFKVKDDGRYKARLVVRGCQQEYGIDYEETFSPVINTSALRIMFKIAAMKNYKIKKFDIKTAFLYGELKNEEIYMKLPEGYTEIKNKLCKLKKALYGLKQAPLRWNEYFKEFLKKKGLLSLKTEQCIFKNKSGTLILAIYVDDGMIIGESEEEINDLLDGLKEKFEMVEYKKVTTFLGIEITQNEEGIKISQGKYTGNILNKFRMEEAKPANTPMTSNKVEKEANRNEKYPYREVVGSLLYLTNKTRPDIAYAVNYGSRKIENPTDQDVQNVKQIMKYLKSTKEEGIIYKRKEDTFELIAYSDADFAGDEETRKSTTGYVVYFGEGPISWCSRKQPIVALSSTEAEYIAAADCVKELLYLKSLIEELLEIEVKVTLNVDNQSAIRIIKNGQFNRRSKHIDVRYHFISEKVNDGIIKIKYCATEEQIADIFTKPLGKCKFKKHKNCLVC